jgi:hypothetical protein
MTNGRSDGCSRHKRSRAGREMIGKSVRDVQGRDNGSLK